jgi:LuxR family maltose regulon positive regulatory protein
MKISINTVKSYTAIAYRKLGVNNAMDAISKAKQIGLLTAP